MDRADRMGDDRPEFNFDESAQRPTPMAEGPLSRHPRGEGGDLSHGDSAYMAGDHPADGELSRYASAPPTPPLPTIPEFPRFTPRTPRVSLPPAVVTHTPDRGQIEQRPVRPPLGRVSIDRLEESAPARERQPGSDEDVTNRRPDERRVSQAVLAGRRVERFFEWRNGRATVTGTPDMAPPNSDTTDLQRTDPEAAQAPAAERGTKIARLKAVYGTPAEGEQLNREEKTATADLDTLVNRFRGSHFTIGVVADGVPRGEHEDLIKDAASRVSNVKSSGLVTTANEDAAQQQERLETFASARHTGLARETLLVEADPTELEAIAEAAALAFTSRRPITFEVDRNPDGSVREFDDVQGALTDGNTPTLITAAELADHGTLPEKPLHGLARKSPPTNFDVDHSVPAHIPKVEVGQIVDNNGNPTGRPLEMSREHLAIFAESMAGKSALFRQLGIGIQQGNLERRMAAEAAGEEVYDHEAIVYLDCKNLGEFTHKFSQQVNGALERQLAGTGQEVPEEMYTVNHIVPGGDGVGVRFDLLRPVGQTPADWRQRIDTAIEIMTAKYSTMDADTYRTIKKYLGDTLDTALDMFGIDHLTGRPLYPNGPPATPEGEFVAKLVDEVVAQAGFKGEHKENVSGWVRSELQSIFRGNNGLPLAGTGYRFDPLAALRNEGITSIDLAKIRDAGSRQTTVLAALYDLYDGCAQLNLQENGSEMTDKIRCTVVIDEADIFGNDALGAKLADFLTHARHVGLRFAFAKQGNIKQSMHPDVLVNTPQKILMRTSYAEDMEAFASGAGRTTFEDMEHITGVPDGMFVYKGPRMMRGIRGQTWNPYDEAETPMGSASRVIGPDALVNLDGHPAAFTHEERGAARRLLTEDPLGVAISNWTEVSTIYVASGRPVAEVAGPLAVELRAGLTNAQNPAQARLLNCAIVEAVKAAVDSRPALQHKATREAYTSHLMTHLVAMAQGERLEGWDRPRPDLALDVARYNPHYNANLPTEDPNSWRQFDIVIDGKFGTAKDALIKQMTALRDEVTSARYQELLGEDVLGVTVSEQLDTAVRLKVDTINNVLSAARLLANDQALSPAATDSAWQHIERLVGGRLGQGQPGQNQQASTMTDEEAMALRGAALQALSADIGTFVNTPMTAREAEALSILASNVPVERLLRPEGFATVEEELRATIASHRENAAPVNPTELADLCGVAVQGGTAQAQLEEIERNLEQQHAATVPYITRVRPSPLFFAPDILRGGGTTIDLNMAAVQGFEQDDGLFQQGLRIRIGQPPRIDRTAGGLFARQRNWGPWKAALSTHFIFSPNYQVPPERTRYLVGALGRITREAHNELSALQPNPTAGMASALGTAMSQAMGGN